MTQPFFLSGLRASVHVEDVVMVLLESLPTHKPLPVDLAPPYPFCTEIDVAAGPRYCFSHPCLSNLAPDYFMVWTPMLSYAMINLQLSDPADSLLDDMQVVRWTHARQEAGGHV